MLFQARWKERARVMDGREVSARKRVRRANGTKPARLRHVNTESNDGSIGHAAGDGQREEEHGKEKERKKHPNAVEVTYPWYRYTFLVAAGGVFLGRFTTS